MTSCERPVFVRSVNRFVPCNKCLPCYKRRQSEWSMRMSHQVETYKEQNSGSVFFTLTYADEHLPLAMNYEHKEESKYGTIEIRDIQLFKKRFREYFRRHFNRTNISFTETREYGTVNERPHYHFIAYNVRWKELLPYPLPSCEQRVVKDRDTGQLRITKFASELLTALWSGPNSIRRYSLKRSAKSGKRKSISDAFEQFKLEGKQQSFKAYKAQKERNRWKYLPQPLGRSPESIKAGEIFDTFSYYQVKSLSEGFDSLGYCLCDEATSGNIRYVANYAIKGYYELKNWPKKERCKKDPDDGFYYNRAGEVVAEEDRRKPIRDKYGRLKPSIRHSRGIGKEWCLQHAARLKADLGIYYSFMPVDISGRPCSRIMQTGCAPLPRYYKKLLGLEATDFELKNKELMEMSFLEYKQNTGQSALINDHPSPEDDAQMQELFKEIAYNKDGHSIKLRCTEERKRMAAERAKEIRSMLEFVNSPKLEDMASKKREIYEQELFLIFDEPLHAPVYSDFFPGQRIRLDYYAWCLERNRTRALNQRHRLAEQRSRRMSSGRCA